MHQEPRGMPSCDDANTSIALPNRLDHRRRPMKTPRRPRSGVEISRVSLEGSHAGSGP